jgi:hypothetical protein
MNRARQEISCKYPCSQPRYRARMHFFAVCSLFCCQRWLTPSLCCSIQMSFRNLFGQKNVIHRHPIRMCIFLVKKMRCFSLDSFSYRKMRLFWPAEPPLTFWPAEPPMMFWPAEPASPMMNQGTCALFVMFWLVV